MQPALRPTCRLLGARFVGWGRPAVAGRAAGFQAAGLRGFAAVPAALVKELRDRTGASMGKCREALSEEAGDVEKAVQWLKKRGMRSMEKRAAEAGEALLSLSLGPSAGAIVELRAETDFVTRNEIFQQAGLCLAAAAAQRLAAPEALLESELGEEAAAQLKQVTPGTKVSAALLELGSVLGERLVLGQAQHLQAPAGGVVAGYVHPKQADGLPGTGRMAALVAMQPAPAEGCDLERLHASASKLARHIVAVQPRYLTVASVPAAELQREREAFKAAHAEQLGPKKAAALDEAVWEKVLGGKTQRFYSETVLMCQELVAPQAGGEACPMPVAEWLEEEARALGVERLLVEDFKVLSL
mmetsp:Transcript_51811/g.160699  ORF Transcript_51811/g.160699 Transcript_51811/m.160699 type:complete len:357 (-) Transcript_51811:60-1130(-)